MSKVFIVRGQHRNEKVAYNLALDVARELQLEGLDCELTETKGLHSIVEGLPQVGNHAIQDFLMCVRKGYYGDLTYGGNAERFANNPIFDFHNSSDHIMNPNNIPLSELPATCNESCDSRYNQYTGDDISWSQGPYARLNFIHGRPIKKQSKISWSENIFVVEVPAVYMPYSSEERKYYLSCVKPLMEAYPIVKRNFDELIGNYLVSYADIHLSRQKGYLSKTMIAEIIALIKRLVIIHHSPRPDIREQLLGLSFERTN